MTPELWGLLIGAWFGLIGYIIGRGQSGPLVVITKNTAGTGQTIIGGGKP